MPIARLILSIFPGIDLLGRAFEELGNCIVRGPDPLWGGHIEDFHPPAGVFEGIIGGSPCQDFSLARRTPPTGEGLRLLDEFLRVIAEAFPDWFLLENVPGVPTIRCDGYTMQRLNLRETECGGRQRRLRTFQFGSRDGARLLITRSVTPARYPEPCAMANEGSKADRRSFADFCELQGLPRSFNLPGMSVKAKYKAVGNGVPLTMGRVMAIAVQLRSVTHAQPLCVCDCGRPVRGKSRHATAACRKRMERARRDVGAVTGPGFVTAAESQSRLALP